MLIASTAANEVLTMSETKFENNIGAKTHEGLSAALFRDSMGSLTLNDFKQLTNNKSDQNLSGILPSMELFHHEVAFSMGLKTAEKTAGTQKAESPEEHRERLGINGGTRPDLDSHKYEPGRYDPEHQEKQRDPWEKMQRKEPPAEPGTPEYYQRILKSGYTPDKMEAAAKLGNGAEGTISVIGKEVPVKVQMTETETDGVYLVNIYAYDENGKPYVAYRGVYNENTGKVSHQLDKDGNEVPYMTEEFYKNYEYEVTQKDAERGRFALPKKDSAE